MGFLWVPPPFQKRTWQVNGTLKFGPRYNRERGCLVVSFVPPRLIFSMAKALQFDPRSLFSGLPSECSTLWPMEKMKAYFCVIKRLQPQVSVEANAILSRYYQLQRQSRGRNAARTTIRMLESLSRLAEGEDVTWKILSFEM